MREALRQLAFEGLVDYCPNKGCTVALLSPQDAYESLFFSARQPRKAGNPEKATAVSVTIVS